MVEWSHLRVMPAWAVLVLAFPVVATTPENEPSSGSPPNLLQAPFCKSGDPLQLFTMTTPPDRNAERKLDMRMKWLAASDASDRERAHDVFSGVEPYALPRLRILHRNATTEELRDTIRCIVREMYVTLCECADTGYLGVSFASRQRHWTPESGWVDVEPRPRPGEVSEAPDGFPAQLAGIKPGDVIASLDGENMVQDGQFAGDRFRRKVQRRKPGTQVIVGVRRGEADFSFLATLAAFPPDLYARYRMPVSDEVRSIVETTFPAWWAKYFEGDSDEGLTAEAPKPD